MRSAARAIVGLVLVALLLGSCTATDDRDRAEPGAAPPVWTAEPPFPDGTSFAVVASVDDLLVVRSLSAIARFDEPDLGQTWFAARRRDGGWAALPNPPEPYGSSALANVDGRLVLAGVRCEDRSECVTGRTEWFRLSPDLAGWEPFAEAEPFENRAEAVVTAMPGRHEVGVFSTPEGTVAVDGGGRIADVPPNRGGGLGDGSACIVGSTLVDVVAPVEAPAARSTPGGTVAVEVSMLDLTDPDAGWRPAPAAPAEARPSARAACLADGIVFLVDGVETVFRPADTTWTTRADPAGPLLAGRTLEPGSSQGLTDDGTFHVITGAGYPILRRAVDGTWTDTAVTAASVATTGTDAYAVDLDGTTELELLPAS